MFGVPRAAWPSGLGTALQKLVRRFDSARRLAGKPLLRKGFSPLPTSWQLAHGAAMSRLCRGRLGGRRRKPASLVVAADAGEVRAWPHGAGRSEQGIGKVRTPEIGLSQIR